MSEIIRAAGVLSVPKEITELAETLSSIHKVVSIHSEASGIHLHLPDPELLETDGKKEFNSRHLTINAEMYLGVGRYDVDTHPTSENRNIWEKYRSKGREVPCAKCHKTDKPYSVASLLMMQPVDKRGLNLGKVKKRVTIGADSSMNLVDDGTGTLVPDWCGETVPLHELPLSHPAIVYLASRGYNPFLESKRYGLCYCKKAKPASRVNGIFYSRAGSLLNTPEGRIIIPIMVNGHRAGYQCRLIDRERNGVKEVWQGGKWNYVGEDEKRLHKYMNAVGSNRNAILFGYDQAVEYCRGKEDKPAVLVEGPLDAVRVGPPAIAVLGASLSPTQAELIVSKFNRVVVVGDNDVPGQRAVSKIIGVLTECGMNPSCISEIKVPDGKDIGGMTYSAAAELLKNVL